MPDCIVPIYLPASYKGVPFEAVSTSDTFGRRGAEYEYPLGEDTAYKDLGRKIRKYKVEGRIVSGVHGLVSNAMTLAVETPGPGLLVHPIFGPVMVACTSLTVGIEYIEKKRYTKLEFEFVEANASMAPFSIGFAVSAIVTIVSLAVAASRRRAPWRNSPGASAGALAVSTGLARQVAPAVEEGSLDVIDMLNRGLRTATVYDDFDRTLDPIVAGTAQVRILHEDAMARLRQFNATVVEQVTRHPDIESLSVSARLSLVGDFALTSMQYPYPNLALAVNDLDFVMQVYDEEEQVAASKGDDVLVNAITAARAQASAAILAQNIQLPGIVTYDARGQWPSLVAAQNIYQDGSRFTELESHNPNGNPFFMPRHLVGLSR